MKSLNLQQLARTGELAPNANPSVPLAPKPALQTLTPRSNDLPKVVLNAQVVDLSIARTAAAPLRLDIRGSVLAVNYTTLASDVAQLRLNGEGSYVTVGAGWKVSGIPFDFVELINQAQTGDVLELAYALDPAGVFDIRYR